jgi:hypothetical protein
MFNAIGSYKTEQNNKTDAPRSPAILSSLIITPLLSTPLSLRHALIITPLSSRPHHHALIITLESSPSSLLWTWEIHGVYSVNFLLLELDL